MRVIVLGAVLFLFAVSAGAGSTARTNGGYGSVDSLSCTAVGECAAGGYYHDNHGIKGFVVEEKGGTWGTAIEVPGLAKLDVAGGGYVDSLSCASPGECAAGGSYYYTPDRSQAFVVNETNGSWGNAIPVPGLAKLNAGHDAYVTSISCGAVGDCAAGGVYYSGPGNNEAFVVSETNGVWGKAIRVPGTATFNTADVNSVSCAGAGECVAGGDYQDGFDPDGGLRLQAFVVSETSGIWGTAIEVPGTAKLNKSANAEVNSVSCATPGNCAAGGSYVDSHHRSQAFVAGETNGTWGTAAEVPGSATLNAGGDAQVNSVSCAAAGECAAGGGYADGKSISQAFVVNETNGVWGTAIAVPGAAKLNGGGFAEVDSISCVSAGECAAGGNYNDGDSLQVFVVSETSGTWGKAIEVPGTSKLNSGGDAQVYSVSCAAAGECATGGFFNPAGRRRPLDRAFLADETNGSWGTAAIVQGLPAMCVVSRLVGKTLRAAKKTLHAAGCLVGKITYAYSNARRGIVVAQRPRVPKPSMFGPESTLLRVTTGVRLKVSKGSGHP